jgi:trk system potassium uptake protein TrkA
MNLIVIGCGRLGSELALRLFQQKNQVVVVDVDDKAFDNLHASFRGRTIQGDALSRGVLERAGVQNASGLAAVTSSDSINATVAHLARSVYKVPYVVSRNYDPRFRPLHEAFGLQNVSSAVWGAQRIEEMLYHGEVYTIFSAGNGEVEIYELMVSDPWHHHQVAELVPAEHCAPVAITRAGRAFLPTPLSLVEKGDLIQVSATLEGARLLRQRLAAGPEVA